MKQRFYSHGKLLISGEYAVLDGARALAVPTRKGQWLEVVPEDGTGLRWTSRDADGNIWLDVRFSPDDLEAPTVSGPFPKEPGEGLLRILRAAIALNPKFAELCRGTRVETRLEFPRAWGLGSSSTLIASLALWSETDPYRLLEATMGGSGYDLACASASGPVFYTKNKGASPVVEPAPFNPPFVESLFLVYLNVKQNSREGIMRYREAGGMSPAGIAEISRLGNTLATTRKLGTFREAMDKHEALVAGVLGMDPIKSAYFPDFDGSVKSLGAWGGDFALVAGGTDAPAYFASRGYPTCFPFSELVLV